MSDPVIKRAEKRQRSVQTLVRWTPEEKRQADAAAERAGMTLGAYIRHQALGTAGPRAARRPNPNRGIIAQLIGQLSSIGNNLNQQVRLGHLGEPVPLRESSATLRGVDALLDECLRALGRRT